MVPYIGHSVRVDHLTCNFKKDLKFKLLTQELLEQNKDLMNSEVDKIKEEVKLLLYELETECYS